MYFFFFNIYLLGCIRAQLHHVVSFTVAHRLSSCSMRVPECTGLAALQHAGS